MQELKLAEHLFSDIFDGTKQCTIRLGKRDIVKGSLALEAVKGGSGLIVNVTEVVHKKVSDLTDDDARLDGADSVDELRKALLHFYPKMQDDSDVTVVKFEFRDPFILEEIMDISL